MPRSCRSPVMSQLAAGPAQPSRTRCSCPALSLPSPPRLHQGRRCHRPDRHGRRPHRPRRVQTDTAQRPSRGASQSISICQQCPRRDGQHTRPGLCVCLSLGHTYLTWPSETCFQMDGSGRLVQTTEADDRCLKFGDETTSIR